MSNIETLETFLKKGSRVSSFYKITMFFFYSDYDSFDLVFPNDLLIYDGHIPFNQISQKLLELLIRNIMAQFCISFFLFIQKYFDFILQKRMFF
jgi:hypothetical protein